MGNFFGNLLEPLYYAVSWIMVAFHSLFTMLGLGRGSGWSWGLSIVGLVVVIRILLIPLFVKQIKAQRGLQLLQPQIKALQAKHKDDRERQSQELMKLYKETGTNPLASCLPVLAQAPIFLALFKVLNGVGANPPVGRGVLTDSLAASAADATVLGAPISATFLRAGEHANSGTIQVVTMVMIVLMSASTFVTQKQLMTKNMPATSGDNPFMQQQKILLYVFPVIFAVSGVNFPIGVLLYWLTTNIWSMGQQLYVIRRMPSPGSVAAENLERRRAARAGRHGGEPSTPVDPAAGSAAGSAAVAEPAAGAPPRSAPARPTGGQRQQPKWAPRAKRPGQPGQAAAARRPPEPRGGPDPS